MPLIHESLEPFESFGKSLYMQKNVKRWNGRLTINEQNIAEHHAYVAQTVLLILDNYCVPEEFHLPALKAAVVHDIVEVHTNDISYTIKSMFPSFNVFYSNLELDIEDKLIDKSLVHRLEKGSIPWLVMKLADSLDVLFYTSLEKELGSKNEDILSIYEDSKTRVKDIGERLLKELEGQARNDRDR